MHVGSYYINQRQFDVAIKLFEQIVAAGLKKDLAYFFLGHCYEALGSLPKAEEMYLMALPLAPEPSLVLVELGNVYLEEKRYQESIGMLVRSIAIGAKFRIRPSYRPYYFLALDYSALENYPKSEKMFLKAMALISQNAPQLSVAGLLILTYYPLKPKHPNPENNFLRLFF